MKEIMRIMITIVMLTMGVIISKENVQATQISTNSLLFVTDNNELVDNYAYDMVKKHIMVAIQSGQTFETDKFYMTKGIKQYVLENNYLLGTDMYHYFIYNDKDIVLTMIVTVLTDGSMSSTVTDAYVDILNQELNNSNIYMLISNESSLYLANESDKIVFLEGINGETTLSLEYENKDIINQHIDVYSSEDLNIALYPMVLANPIDLNVPLVRQYANPICWAASMASILNYSSGTSYTALDVANKTGNGNASATYVKVKSYYTNVYSKTISSGGAMTSSAVATQLNNGKPIQVFHYTTTDEGHSMVLKGMSQVSSDVFYIYMDPNAYNFRSVSISEAAKSDGTQVAVSVAGKTMKWRYSIYNIR